MNEHWIRWEPLPGLKPRYYIVSVTDNTKGFEIILETINTAEKAVRIFFENSVESYRLIDESYAGGIGPTDENSKESFEPWCFFKIKNSKYLKWFIDTSVGMVEIRKRNFIHFSILGENSYLDIIADTNSEPIVEFVDRTIA